MFDVQNINDRFLEKKSKTIEFCKLLQNNDINGIKFFLFNNRTTLVNFKMYIKEIISDVLVVAVEYNCSEEMIKYIINEGKYDDLNYEAIFEENGYKSPLITAIKNEFFNIADVLIENGADINGEIQNTDILSYLDCIGVLNHDILKYLLNNGYDLDYLDAFTINNLKCKHVQTIFDCIAPTKLDIRNDWYLEAIHKKNYEMLALFISNDNEGKRVGFARAIALLESYDRKNHTARKNVFTNKLRRHVLPLNIDDSTIESVIIPRIKEKRDRIKKLIKNGEPNQFKNYIIRHKIPLNNFNTEKFDILIYAIEQKASLDFIKIIKIIGPYHSYNFSIIAKPLFKTKTTKDTENFKTPLTAAICKERFDIADFLIENGADLYYHHSSTLDENGFHSTILDYFYRNKCLNEAILNYIYSKRPNDDDELTIQPNTIEEAIELGDNDAAKVVIKFFHMPVKKEWYKIIIMNGNAEMLDYLIENDSQNSKQVFSHILTIINKEDIDEEVFMKASNIKNKELSVKLREAFLSKLFSSLIILK